MCLHGALSSILFNLICNMTTFRKKKFLPFDPIWGLRVCVRTDIFLHGALCSIPFNLICNMTTFQFKQMF